MPSPKKIVGDDHDDYSKRSGVWQYMHGNYMGNSLSPIIYKSNKPGLNADTIEYDIKKDTAWSE